MRFGLVVPNRGIGAIDNVRRLPRVAEEAGYDSVWLTDHVVGVRSFEPVYGAEWLEALTTLAYVARGTSTVRLGIGVLVAPYRDPVMAAKILSTLDGLSDGRLDVGVGAGWSRSEFHGLGRGEVYEQRGKVTDETLEVILRCWQGGELAWDGDVSRFRRIEFAPVPVQAPRPPIWIGGHTKPALRRAARFADVWHPSNVPPDEIAARSAELAEIRGARIPCAVRLRVAPGADLGEIADHVAAYEAVGCDGAVIEVDTDDGPSVETWAVGFAKRIARAGR